ncbi:MAG: acetate--CoA ligase family protein [Candidatus Hodarchaeota archaeon]
MENPLETILNPRSIVFYGANNNYMKMGSTQLLNILIAGYPGEIFPIHPREDEVQGFKAYKTVLDILPEKDLDFAFIVLPSEAVPKVLEECGQRGIKHAVVVSAGFREMGEIDLRKELLDITDKYGIKFLGPNCFGFFNNYISWDESKEGAINTTWVALNPKKGRVSIASQSGTFMSHVFMYARHKSPIGFNKTISLGNEASIDLVDSLEYLGNDPGTKVIGLYIEEIKRPREFMDVARRIISSKPIVALYVGGTKAGGRAVSSHTGSLAGNDQMFDAMVKQVGIIRAMNLEELLIYCYVLDVCPVPPGDRVCIFTNAGGPGANMADIAERLDIQVPEFSQELQDQLRTGLVSTAQVKNMVDLTFELDISKQYSGLPKKILKSDEVDGMLVYGIFGTTFFKLIEGYDVKAMFPIEEMEAVLFPMLKRYARFPEKYGKPIIASSMLGREDNAVAYLQDLNIPVFEMPYQAVKAFWALTQYRKILEKFKNQQ